MRQNKKGANIILIGLLILYPFNAIGVLHFSSAYYTSEKDISILIVDDDSDQDYHSIQSAVDAANPGDYIYVYAGMYNEDIIIDKELTLVGNGSSVTFINGSKNGDVVQITSNGVLITGFNITNSGPSSSDAGIKIDSVDSCIIDNCSCSNNSNGIQVVDSDDSVIINNTCNSNECGIYIQYSSHNLISNNTCCLNEGTGIRLAGNEYYDYGSSDFNILTNNVCISNQYNGISLGGSDNTIISDNTCDSNNEYGLSIYAADMYRNCEHNAIYNNSFNSNNRKGIVLTQSAGGSLSYNTIHNNTCSFNSNNGMYIYSQHVDGKIGYNTISENSFCSNTRYAIYIRSWYSHMYSNNFIYYNTISENNGGDVQAFDGTEINNWNSSGGIGNYWSDYTTRYPGADGNRYVWNTPYEVDYNEKAKDNYPLCAPPGESGKPFQESDHTPSMPTTGDDFTFIADFSDNYFVTSANVVYSYDERDTLNESMDFISSTRWMKTITIPNNVTYLSYYYYLEDAANNYFISPNKTLNVMDNDAPVLAWENITDGPTTGDDLTVLARFEDNFNVSEAFFNYAYGEFLYYNTSMKCAENGIWNCTITITPWATSLRYYFDIWDINGNFKETVMTMVPVHDNDLPTLLADTSPANASTGDEYTFSVRLTDNIGVTEALVSYAFDNGSYFNESLLHVGPEKWEITINISQKATSMSYTILFADETHNLNSTSTRTLVIFDNDPPELLEDRSSVTGTTGDPFIFSASFKDNIGVNEVYVNYSFNTLSSQQKQLFELDDGGWFGTIMIPENANYMEFFFHAQDPGGNELYTATKNVTVDDNDPPIANAGTDMIIEQYTFVTFDGTNSSENIGLLNFTWQFFYNGDEIMRFGREFSFYFDKSGNYSILLTVTDGSGNTAEDVINVTVNKKIIEDNDEDDNDELPADDDTLSGGETTDRSGKLWFWSILIGGMIGILIIVAILYITKYGRKKKETADTSSSFESSPLEEQSSGPSSRYSDAALENDPPMFNPETPLPPEK